MCKALIQWETPFKLKLNELAVYLRKMCGALVQLELDASKYKCLSKQKEKEKEIVATRLHVFYNQRRKMVDLE